MPALMEAVAANSMRIARKPDSRPQIGRAIPSCLRRPREAKSGVRQFFGPSTGLNRVVSVQIRSRACKQVLVPAVLPD